MQIPAYETIKVSFDGTVCTLQIYRPEANNTINDLFTDECADFLNRHSEHISVLIIKGLPEVFCFGADFSAINDNVADGDPKGQNPENIYNVWQQIANGPFISIAHVRGKANAGGIGFVAACDIVLAEENAVFSLSELLFGLLPACVLPFLIRRMGPQKAHYMTMMTQPVSAQRALEWGLVDACEENSENLLRKHLLRLTRLSKTAIVRYKKYRAELDNSLEQQKACALKTNLEVFTDPDNLNSISRYVETGKFPWEK
ncbi:enoyl-CoA hydratase/isomerase [Gynuella sunshinyii]|nr:enoyl-CoA hydratase/isomerase [Gynuella sunshinyii]AJQ95092.1 enoyl-CoA hydratase/carnithine racemase [Gynuella sunshinyii YC6258]